MGPDRIKDIAQKTVRGGTAAALLYAGALPFAHQAIAGGCTETQIGPFQANHPASPVALVSQENGLVQGQVWNPGKLGTDKPVNYVLDASYPSMEVDPETAGIAWRLTDCDRDTALATISPRIKGQPYAEIADLVQKGVLIPRPDLAPQKPAAAPTMPTAPAPKEQPSAPKQYVEFAPEVPGSCEYIEKAADFTDPAQATPFTIPAARFALVQRFGQMPDTQKAELVDIFLDRDHQDQTYVFGPNATGAVFITPPGCGFMEVHTMIDARANAAGRRVVDASFALPNNLLRQSNGQVEQAAPKTAPETSEQIAEACQNAENVNLTDPNQEYAVEVGDQMAQIEAYAPHLGLGEKPAEIPVDRSPKTRVLHFAKGVVGHVWKFGKDCLHDDAMKVIAGSVKKSGNPYVELSTAVDKQVVTISEK